MAGDLTDFVGTIVDTVCTPEHQCELDRLDQRFDKKLWLKLINSDTMPSAVAKWLGGDGFGVLDQAAVLVAQGQRLATVPYLEPMALGAAYWPVLASRAFSRS
ncbi:hypothetical protein ABFA25_05820 [Mycobacterium lepromatosis]|nr:hypothetical protein [Mycobacterium lepromatosis]